MMHHCIQIYQTSMISRVIFSVSWLHNNNNNKQIAVGTKRIQRASQINPKYGHISSNSNLKLIIGAPGLSSGVGNSNL